jgi:CobQ-like glutamine amidotransferase family enzyme
VRGSELTIGVLLPEVLGTYSDSGNAIVLAQRARWRGINAHVLPISAEDTPPAGCELYLLGGGEDAAQVFAIEWLTRHRGLRHAMAGPALTLAVCAGLQILGTTLTDLEGRRRDGLGLLDLTTKPGKRRAVGETITSCQVPGVGLLTGFENHRGATTLGAGTRPLGRVLTGVGNGARHPGGPVEGALTEHVVATYLHGPVLARNPALADHLLHRITGQAFAADTADVPDLPKLRRTYLPRTPPRRRRGIRPWSRR